MAKLTDARVVTLKGHFNTGDQPSEANFADLIQWIQEGIEEHDHAGTGDGDGVNNLVGPVGIGTAAPAVRLDVIENAAGHAARIFNDGNNDNRSGLAIVCGADANPAARLINFYDGNEDLIGYVVGDGGGGVTYHSVSDERSKDILGPVDQDLAIQALVEVDPIQYVGKGGGKHKNIGFSAQDIHRYFPEVVNYDEELDRYSIAYGRLVPVLWAQNQALLARIEAGGL